MSLKKLFKRGLVTLMVGVLTLGMVACSDNKEEINTSTLDKQELIVGFDDTFVPMGFKEGNDYTGFDIEMAREVCKVLGKEVEFQPIDWKMKETELKSGNIDLIWNGYSITDERKESVEFSKAYLNNRQVILTLAESDIKTKEDLKNKKVGAQSESSAVDAIGDYKSNFKELVTFDTNVLAIKDLQAGRVDAVVADEVLLKYYVKQEGAEKFKYANDDFGKEEYAVGVRKGDIKFVDELNKAFDEVVDSGKATEISKKWFGEDIIVK